MLALVFFLFLAFPRFQFVEKRDESDDYSYHADKQCDEVVVFLCKGDDAVHDG